MKCYILSSDCHIDYTTAEILFGMAVLTLNVDLDLSKFNSDMWHNF